MEELVIRMLENAPAVVVLIYLVWRLDTRLADLEDKLIELLSQR